MVHTYLFPNVPLNVYTVYVKQNHLARYKKWQGQSKQQISDYGHIAMCNQILAKS